MTQIRIIFRSFRAKAWLILLILPATALWPAMAFAEGNVVVNPSTVVAGKSVSVHGSGWAPNDQILVSFTDSQGDVVPLGVVLADSNGSFNKTVTVPPTVPPGIYQIDGNGQGGSVTVTIKVIASTPVPAPPTPT
ncbi:MAG TPA: hypothetical protein VKX96_14740, partial [Chloroflexota bacterium]|nr:hypothetical protein [Chloroflexota bacterium]